jgi:hypothetical protein
MRVINVVVIKEGVIDNIDSFGVFEEQLVEDVVKPAEELFKDKCREWGALEDDMDYYLDEGCYVGGNFSICISWSEI